MFKAYLAALRYLAGVKIASEAGLGSLGNGTFPLGWRWSQELSIALSMFLALKLKLSCWWRSRTIFFVDSRKCFRVNGGPSLSELGLKTRRPKCNLRKAGWALGLCVNPVYLVLPFVF